MWIILIGLCHLRTGKGDFFLKYIYFKIRSPLESNINNILKWKKNYCFLQQNSEKTGRFYLFISLLLLVSFMWYSKEGGWVSDPAVLIHLLWQNTFRGLCRSPTSYDKGYYYYYYGNSFDFMGFHEGVLRTPGDYWPHLWEVLCCPCSLWSGQTDMCKYWEGRRWKQPGDFWPVSLHWDKLVS